MNKKIILRLLTPFLISLFFVVLGLTGVFTSVDYAFFDAQLHLTKTPNESDRVLLIDVDDATIDPHSGISTWPIPREYYGQALLTLKEFEVQSAVFDIEFLGRSQLEFAPDDFQSGFVYPLLDNLDMMDQNVDSYLNGMYAEYLAGNISQEQFKGALADVIAANRESALTINRLVQDFSFDRDAYLARGSQIFGNAYFASGLRAFELDDTKYQEEFYEASAEQIFYLIEAAPELLTADISKFLNRPQYLAMLVALEPLLSTLTADTNIEEMVRTTAQENNIQLMEIEYALLANPNILALSYEIAALLQSVALNNVVEDDKADVIPSYPFIEFPTDVVLRGVKGIAFSNVKIDKDGTRRRVQLVSKTGDFYYPQLGFSALLTMLQNPTVTVKSNRVILENALLPGETETKTINIPLDSEGCMLVNWPHKQFLGERDDNGNRLPGRKGEDSFTHISFLKIHKSVALEEHLYNFLSGISMEERYNYYADWQSLLELFDQISATRRELIYENYSDDLIEQYRHMKQELDYQLEVLLSPPVLGMLLHEVESGSYTADEEAQMMAMHAEVTQATRELAGYLASYQEARQDCAKLLPGKLAIFGFTASATTDFGVTPFQEDYPNVGTHAAAVNTILQEDYLNEVPFWVSILLAFILSFALYFVLLPLAPVWQIVGGFSAIILVLVFDWFILFSTGYYLPIFVPLMSMAITFLAETGIHLVVTSKEKNYVRKAFAHYLSTDVINEIMKDPDKLKLGGDSRYMTAVFTDVASFSTISEQLTAVELVTLLNEYLSAMSDIILDLRGLIDKYEGDAIIAFFGAPNELKEHAYNTCLSAIRMHRIEAELNAQFMDRKMTPFPLLTRIGINTGEMVVGNMGTATKMNYTMMGSAVNLAARLEGVNKQYGTFILMSGETYNAGGNKFFCRRVDRVRVVGIHEPVQLYELIEEEHNVTDAQRKGVELYHEAFALYEARDWHAAIDKFNQVLELMPEDGPAQKFIGKCEIFEKRPPEADWDGVSNLTSK